jgi:hypothetical protein
MGDSAQLQVFDQKQATDEQLRQIHAWRVRSRQDDWPELAPPALPETQDHPAFITVSVRPDQRRKP